MRPISLTGRVARLPLVRDPWKRRAVVLLLAVVLILLAFYPQRYRAVVALSPTDPGALGLGGALGQLGATNNIFGNQIAIEVALKIIDGPFVRKRVMDKLDLSRRLGRSPLETSRWLGRHMESRVMRGGIIQIETELRDPKLGIELVGAYSDAIRSQLTELQHQQTGYKRKILIELIQDASNRYAEAQARYDTFRLKTRYSAPESAIAGLGERIPLLEGLIKTKESELLTAERFATGNNFSIQRTRAELGALQTQLEIARSVSTESPDAVGRVVKQTTEVDKLKRELDIAQSLYMNYKKYLEGTSVEDLTANANIRILETPYIAPDRQHNDLYLGLALLVLALGAAIEFYGLQPPLEAHEPA